MLTTTLDKIRKHSPCARGWHKLLSNLGKTKADDEPISLLLIMRSNGLIDALWCLRCWPEHDNTWRLLSVQYARDVQHLIKDKQLLDVLEVAEKYANGLATYNELSTARDAAWGAASAAAFDAARERQKWQFIEAVRMAGRKNVATRINSKGTGN